ncbi:MAG: ATP-dependent Clp protease adaptor protein ClpS [Blastocatellia bacterium]|jgi:ATP-dependent Clp protease adaptor protein ClpS|nr:ATP-dependent Clp protease adaptor protein ClpS [Blastocatellia bacterium]
MSTPDYENEDAVVSESKEELKKPPLYKVLIHNDDFTTMEFVVHVLTEVFNRAESDAFRIMLQVHVEGVGVAGVFTYEIAQMKAEKATNLAQTHEFPLLFTVEEE